MRQAKSLISKKEFAYQALREAILTGELAPGERLIIDDLSTQLGVSQIPVREALQLLEADGFVAIEPYVGAHVSEIHEGLVQEVFALLEAMEMISAQAACQKMKPGDFNHLEQILCQMDAKVDDPEAWSQDNIRLHEFICERANMFLVKDLFLRVAEHWNRLRRHYLTGVLSQRMHIAQQDHWKLLEALKTKDPEYVAGVIRRHNQSALQDYLHYLDQSQPG